MAFMPKFTYNATEGRCVSYTYGGCGGSQNLFNTELECLQTCDIDYNDDTPSTVDACGLEIDAGPCRMRKPMYGFNKGTKRCEKFSYGGNISDFHPISCVNVNCANPHSLTLKTSHPVVVSIGFDVISPVLHFFRAASAKKKSVGGSLFPLECISFQAYFSKKQASRAKLKCIFERSDKLLHYLAGRY